MEEFVENEISEEKRRKKVLEELEGKRVDQIAWIKKLLKDGYEFTARNQPTSMGYITVLSINSRKIKEIHHAGPI